MRTAETPAFSTKAPTPCGPPSLCEDRVRESASSARMSTGTFPADWIASTCSHPPAARTSRAASAIGWITPLSLFA